MVTVYDKKGVMECRLYLTHCDFTWYNSRWDSYEKSLKVVGHTDLDYEESWQHFGQKKALFLKCFPTLNNFGLPSWKFSTAFKHYKC